jgi:GAF domain-containing protein
MLATPVRMHNFAGGDFGDRTVSSLQTIIDNPVQMLGQSRANVGNPAHTHLDILSASRYPHALIPGYDSDHVSVKRKQPHHTGSPQLYGGLFRKSDSQEVSNDSSLAEQEAAPARPKKKARKTKKDEDEASEESKRQRGRPRLDIQDETAADRRRTQIRLAQRAYRHRKETTISALKQQVAALQATIEQMNKTFLDLHDNLIEAGITTSHVRVARQLKMATQEFVSLAKIAEEENDNEATKIAEITGNGNGAHENRFEAEPDSHSINAEQQSSPRDSLANDAGVEELPLVSHTYPYIEHSSWGINTDTMSFRADVPEPQIDIEKLLGEKARHAAAVLFPSSAIEYPLSSPAGKNGSYTYSFQETNFSRRLHRRSLENGKLSATLVVIAGTNAWQAGATLRTPR